ncbi:MAG: tail fiber domain-containing protein [Verrucomicrobiales bacterium]|nr:tail fiber domain-containing protein [Verrucomicrobiales bacterium]
MRFLQNGRSLLIEGSTMCRVGFAPTGGSEVGYIGYGATDGDLSIANGLPGKATRVAGATVILDGPAIARYSTDLQGDVLIRGNLTTAKKIIGQSFELVSDEAQKNIIEIVDDAKSLAAFREVAAYRFTYKGAPGEERLGLIAQQAQKAMNVGDGKHLNVSDFMGFMASALKAIDRIQIDAQREIADLKQQVDLLRQQLGVEHFDDRSIRAE